MSKKNRKKLDVQIDTGERYICQLCGAVHRFEAKQCSRCDCPHVRMTNVTDFGGIQEGDIGWRPRRLARLCDIYGMNAHNVIKKPTLLAEAGLDDVPLPDAVVAEADRLDRELAERIRARTKRYKALTEPKPEPIITKPIEKPTSRPMPAKPPSTRLSKNAKIFDYPVTSVIRWMGKHKWKPEHVQKVLDHFQLAVNKSTIQTCLTDGRRPDEKYGKRAKMSGKEKAELKKLAGK